MHSRINITYIIYIYIIIYNSPVCTDRCPRIRQNISATQPHQPKTLNDLRYPTRKIMKNLSKSQLASDSFLDIVSFWVLGLLRSKKITYGVSPAIHISFWVCSGGVLVVFGWCSVDKPSRPWSWRQDARPSPHKSCAWGLAAL